MNLGQRRNCISQRYEIKSFDLKGDLLKVSRKHGEHWSFGARVYQAGGHNVSGGNKGWFPSSYLLS
jgi:hypothetical protein